MAGGLVAAVDLGASRLRCALADGAGELVARRSEPVDAAAGPETVVERMVNVLTSLLAERGERAPPRAIGIGLPGVVVPGEGTVLAPTNLPAWQTVPLADLVRRRWPIPLALENDANMGALGEGWRGAARGMRTFIFVALGTGIGAGLVIDGRLHRGASGYAGEVCYVCLGPEHLGIDYGPGGCLEGLVGGPGITRRGSQALGRAVSSEEVFALARRGDAKALAVVQETAEYLGIVFAGMAAVLDPEAIVVGGGIGQQGELLLAPLREVVRRLLPTPVAIVPSALGEDAQLYGAVRSALDAARRG